MPPETPLSVLVVEDEAVVAMDLQRTLGELGYDAYAIAASAREAILCATERRPDLALVDLRIQGDLDGVATARELRSRFGVPVVYLTAHADDASIARAKTTEPLGYLLKPVRPAELRSTLEVGYYRFVAERASREREDWISAALAAVPDAVIAVGPTGNIVLSNDAAARLFAERGERGRSVEVLLAAIQGAPAVLAEARRDRHVVTARGLSWSTPEHGPRIVDVEAAPVFDGSAVLGAVVAVRDVTEARRVEQQLELTNRLAAIGTLAAGVAHELNNPLAVVVASAEFVAQLIRQHVVDEDELAPAIDDIHVAAERMATIVADLAVFTKRRSAPGQAQADLRRVIDAAVRMTSIEVRGRATVRVDQRANGLVAIEEARLGQVLVNLISNAAHAFADDSRTGTITIRTEPRPGDRVAIEVSDDGPGIPLDVLSRVFEPFFTTRPAKGGTGLGLAISREIVMSAGGTIEVEHRTGGGIRARIELPAILAVEEPSPAPATQQAATAKGPRRARMLLIDDDVLVGRTLTRVFQQSLEVVAVTDPRVALGRIRAGEHFDVVLCDLTMPYMSGIDVYEQIAQYAPALVERTILLTGGALDRREEMFLEKLGDAYLTKPVSLAALREAIGRRAPDVKL